MTPRTRTTRLLAGVAALSLLAAACSSDSDEATSTGGTGDTGTDVSDLAGSIVISGSSTVEPISTRVAELFEDVAPDVRVTVDGPGTGDGFAAFCEGQTDISDASRAIKDAEAETCAANDVEFIELAVAFDGLAIMTNPSNDAIDCVTYPDMYALMGGESEGFSNWSDAEDIAADLGSSTDFPDLSLTISAPGTESGTYDSFIELVLEDIADERDSGDQPIRTDYAGQSDDNVIIQGISGARGSFGWVGFAFAEENSDQVKVLEVDGGDGVCIEPTVETIADGTYPVSRTLYIYVNAEKADSNPALAAYVDFYLTDGYSESVTRAFGESGYVELPEGLLAQTRQTWADRATGAA